MARKSVTLLMRTAGLIATVAITAVLGASFLVPLPEIPGLGWTDRNIFFHVPMWFAMYTLMGISFFWSGAYLVRGREGADLRAREAAVSAMFFGTLGLLTGILWSRVTWAEALPDSDPQAWWGWDPKQTFALVALLLYGAYFVLRRSIREPTLKARLAAVYNIVASILVLPLTFFLPRLLGGLHPGAEGTPAFRSEDISTPHRVLFYLAAVGFIALAVWIWQLRVRLAQIEERLTSVQAPLGEAA